MLQPSVTEDMLSKDFILVLTIRSQEGVTSASALVELERADGTGKLTHTFTLPENLPEILKLIVAVAPHKRVVENVEAKIRAAKLAREVSKGEKDGEREPVES